MAEKPIETATLEAPVLTSYFTHWPVDADAPTDLKRGTMSYLKTLIGGIVDVVEDTAPQLGGDLDTNGHAITSVSNGDITITPNGTGSVVLDGLSWPQADGTDTYVLQTNGAGQLSWVVNGGGGGGLTNWEESGTTLQPTTAGYDLGAVGNEVGDIVMGSSNSITIGGDVTLSRVAANTLKLGVDHATTPTTQHIEGMSVTTGIGGGVSIRGGSGSVKEGSVQLYSYDGNIGIETANGYLGISGGSIIDVTAGDTISLYQDADMDIGNALDIKAIFASRELTDSDGRQAGVYIEHNPKQTGTAAFDALYVNPNIVSLGNGTTGDGNNLLNLSVADSPKFLVSTDGVLNINNNLYLRGDAANTLKLGEDTVSTVPAQQVIQGASSDTNNGGNLVVMAGDGVVDGNLYLYGAGISLGYSATTYMEIIAAGYIDIKSDETIALQQDADLSAGNAVEIRQATPVRELTDTDGRQAGVLIKHEAAQSATAAFDALYINPTITSLGDGSTGDGNNLLNLSVASSPRFLIDTNGNISTNNNSLEIDTGTGSLVLNSTDRAAFVSDATDLTSAVALVNAIKQAVMDHGLMDTA